MIGDYVYGCFQILGQLARRLISFLTILFECLADHAFQALGHGGIQLHGRRWSLIIPSKIIADVVPANGLLPVDISYSTAPREKMPVRPSNSSPRACSGDM